MSEPKEVFVSLASRLDDPEQLPSLPRILALMVTEDEASALLNLPGSYEEIAGKASVEDEFLKATLHKCRTNGIILWVESVGEPVRYAFPDNYVDSIVSDQRNNALGPVYRKLWQAWSQENRARRRFEIDENTEPYCRILPVPRMVGDHNTILPPEDARRVVEASRCRVIQQCSCRYRNRDCEFPVEETCLIFDHMAEQAIARGYAQEASMEEVLQVVERASQLGLVHVSSSTHFADATLGTEFICNCCPCCCELLEPYFASDRKLPLVVNYFAQVDSELCTACAKCEERCHFSAIQVSDDSVAQVQLELCVGCGLCAVACDDEAIELIRSPQAHAQGAPIKRHVINPRK